MPSRIKLYNPDTLHKPAGAYCHVARVKAGEMLFIAGQVGVDQSGKVADGEIEGQADQVYKNLRAALQAEGCDFRHVVQFTTYLVDARDLAKFRKWRDKNYPAFFPDAKYPPNTLLIIDRLAGEDIRIEIAAIAAPD